MWQVQAVSPVVESMGVRTPDRRHVRKRSDCSGSRFP